MAVLGGSGFIGRAATRLLVATHDVVAVDRRHRPAVDDPRVSRIVADVSDAAQLEDALDGCGAVVYAVGAMLPAESTYSPIEDITHTLTPLLQLLQYLSHHPGVRLVFLSSGGTVYGNPAVLPVREDEPTRPLSSYGVLKVTAEHYIGMYAHLHGVDARILRVANAYGPGQPTGRSQGVVANFIDAAVDGRPVTIFGTGRTVRDYIHVDDIALAVEAALQTDGPLVVNVATGIGTSTLQIVSMIEELAGKPMDVDFRPARPFDVDAIVLDAAAYIAMVGTMPISFADGLRETYRHWVDAMMAPSAASSMPVLASLS